MSHWVVAEAVVAVVSWLLIIQCCIYFVAVRRTICQILNPTFNANMKIYRLGTTSKKRVRASNFGDSVKPIFHIQKWRYPHQKKSNRLE